MKRIISGLVLICTVFLVLGSSTTHKTLVATGGSKSDGIVRMSFEHTWLEKPEFSVEQGRLRALARCKSWGYADAEAFGGHTRECIQNSQSGCIRWFVTIEYQCTGRNYFE